MKKTKLIALLTASIMLVGCADAGNSVTNSGNSSAVNSESSKIESSSGTTNVTIAPELRGTINADAEEYKYAISSLLSGYHNAGCDYCINVSNLYGHNTVYGDFCPGVSDKDYGIDLTKITDAQSALTIMEPQISHNCSYVLADSTSCEMVIESQSSKVINGYDAIKIDGHFELDNEKWTMKYNQAKFSGYMIMKDNKYPVYFMIVEDPLSDVKTTAEEMTEMADKIAVTIRDYEG